MDIYIFLIVILFIVIIFATTILAMVIIGINHSDFKANPNSHQSSGHTEALIYATWALAVSTLISAIALFIS